MSEIERIKNLSLLKSAKPGHYPRIEFVQEIKIGTAPPYGTMFLVLLLGAVSSLVLESALIALLALAVLVPLRFVRTNKVSWDQRQHILRAAYAKEITSVAQETDPHLYPSLYKEEYNAQLDRLKKTLNAPRNWGKEKAFPLPNASSADREQRYVVKTGPRKAAIVKKTEIPEENIWLENFYKAIRLK